VQVGRKYYFPDGARAFTDRGRRLTTPSENTEVIRSLVAIAQARGWNDIAVRGSERFRKEAWLAARQAGLGVPGYRPSEFEQAHLVRTLAGQQAAGPGPEAAKASARESGVPSLEARRGMFAGTLVDHGSAPYRHNPREPMSYFVKLETARGERVIWGVDLQRAIKESLTQPKIGDAVGLRAVRQEPVTVKSPQRDDEGKVTRQEELQTHRNRWIAEKEGFFASRAAAAQTLRDTHIDPKQAVKTHPELAGSYLQVQAAKLAARRFRDPQDQQRFVDQVRSALADSVARGEPLPPVRLRERAAARAESRARSAREPPQARG
jgi:putative DNA primase/helicase